MKSISGIVEQSRTTSVVFFPVQYKQCIYMYVYIMCIPSQVEKEIKGNDRAICMYTHSLEVTKQQSCISVTSQLLSTQITIHYTCIYFQNISCRAAWALQLLYTSICLELLSN